MENIKSDNKKSFSLGDDSRCFNCDKGFRKTRYWQRFCGEICRIKAFHKIRADALREYRERNLTE